jgi:hypothetical protein
MRDPLDLLHRVFIQGLSKENRILLTTQHHVAHSRLVNEYGTTGLLAMLVKTITMGFVAVLGEYRYYFEVYEGAATEHTEHLKPQHLSHHHPHLSEVQRSNFTGALLHAAHGGGAAHNSTGFMTLQQHSGMEQVYSENPVSFAYYIYGFLLTFSTLFIFVSMMTSVGNYLALSLIDGKSLLVYMEKTGYFADLPWLCLLWGVTIWHVALMILMFYLVNFEFGIAFVIACSTSIIIVIFSLEKVLTAVDESYKVAEDRLNSERAISERAKATA